MDETEKDSETKNGLKAAGHGHDGEDNAKQDSDYDDREFRIPGCYEENGTYDEQRFLYRSPDGSESQAHWLRFNRSPPIHGSRPVYRSACHRPDCYHCNEPQDNDDCNNDSDLDNDRDSDLDKLDDAATLEETKSSIPKFNFSYFKVVAVSLVLVLVQHTFKVIYMVGLHRTVFNHTPGPCQTLEGISGGSEDIVTLPEGLAFITSGYASYTTDRGRIYTYQHGSSDKPREVRFSEDFDKHRFYPHGMSVWQDPKTEGIIVYCINHHPNGDRIEKFKFNKESNMMEHLKSVVDPTMKYTNNILALDEDRFYFTNSFHGTNPHMVMLEVFLMLSWGTVVYYDGQKGHVVNRGFVLNGIAISPNKQYIYVSSSGSLEIRVFRRNYHDGSIDFVQTFPIETSLDNMNVDPGSGDLWVGAQNSLAEFMSHDKNPVLPCGSRVFRIKSEFEGSKLTRLDELYASDGVAGLSGASVASYYNGSVLIGALRKAPLLCKVLI